MMNFILNVIIPVVTPMAIFLMCFGVVQEIRKQTGVWYAIGGFALLLASATAFGFLQ